MKLDQIKNIVTNNPWTTAIIIRENNKTIFSKNTDKTMKAASLIKLGIALYIKKRMPESIAHTIPLKNEEIVHGAGIINRLTISKWKIADLIDLMLCVSDNTATNALLDFYQIDKINDFLQENYENVQLGRFLMKSGKENLASCKAIMRIFEDLLVPDQKRVTQIIFAALKHQENRNKLVAFSNPEYASFNKTGELAREEHDIVRFKKGDRNIDCCVMTHFQNAKDHEQVIKMMQRLGQLITEV